MIRITGGSLRGRVVRVPVAEGIRPTTERVREALFSIIGQDLHGVRFLDAFGGTGAIALEASSRGADVIVLERDGAAAKDIRARLDAVGVTNVALVPGNVLTHAAKLGIFDVVFADPPWAAPVQPAIDALAKLATASFILEAEAATIVPERAGRLVLERSRNYGRTTLHVYRPE